MTPKLFFAQIEFWFLMHYDLSVFHTQTGLPKDCPGPFHKIMTVSNENFDYMYFETLSLATLFQHSCDVTE